MSSWGFLSVISTSWNKAVGSSPDISLKTFTFSDKFSCKNKVFWCQRYGLDSYRGDLASLDSHLYVFQVVCYMRQQWCRDVCVWERERGNKYFTFIFTVLTETVVFAKHIEFYIAYSCLIIQSTICPSIQWPSGLQSLTEPCAFGSPQEFPAFINKQLNISVCGLCTN